MSRGVGWVAEWSGFVGSGRKEEKQRDRGVGRVGEWSLHVCGGEGVGGGGKAKGTEG